MTHPGFDYVAAIELHSAGFAAAARDNLDAVVDHCPPWSVADLVDHMTEVHWFWATIASERRSEPPPEALRPATAPRAELVSTFEAGARELAKVLRAADFAAAAWTWAPAQQDVAFIARHQVQEAAVHHWDAAHAAGDDVAIAADVAVDSIEEFLTFSVASVHYPSPTTPSLGGVVTLQCRDVDAAWTISDGPEPATLRYQPGWQDNAAIVAATASDLLLWLYGRVDLDTATAGNDLVERFRSMCFTD